MKTRLLILVCCVVACLTVTPLRAMQFYLNVSSHTRGGSTSYAVDVFLDTSEIDYDEFVDGYVLTSPGGDFGIFVDVDSMSGAYGFLCKPSVATGAPNPSRCHLLREPDSFRSCVDNRIRKQ